MFHQEEGRARFWRGRPEQSDDRGGRGGRRYRGEDEDPMPHFAPGPGGPHGHGHGHGPGGHGPGGQSGHGRFGWLPRDFMFGPGRGPMVRRGDVRTAILALLAEQPMHGYQIIGQLGERSGGMWRPSAGSVYPTLQQLENEGLVKGEEKEGRKVYALTEDGKSAARRAGSSALGHAGRVRRRDLYGLFRPLGAAVAQVSQVGTPGRSPRLGRS